MQSLFITGTDTGVGKTTFTAALLAQARAAGIDAVPMKPVQTGCSFEDGRWLAPDLEILLSAAGISPSLKEKEWMCPYRFEPPCSPHRAAQLAGETIRFETIRRCYDQLREQHACVLAEGAGGILAPLTGNRYMIDLMKEMRLPVVLAARSGLGTLNHTLLSLRELRRVGLHVKAVVLIASTPNEPAEIVEDNALTLERTADVPIERMPFFQPLEISPEKLPPIGKAAADAAALSSWRISEHFVR